MKLRTTVSFAVVVLPVFVTRSNGQVAGAPPPVVVVSNHLGSEDGPQAGECRPEALGLGRARELEKALGLTTIQTHEVADISTQESADCQALGPLPSPSSATIRQRARDQIRALLTPEQRAKFNLVPERLGGGLTGKSPWEQLERLDKLVHLTPAQKQPVLNEFIDRTENLMENQGPEKTARAQEIRSVMNAEIRALLTPEQRVVLDALLEKHQKKSDSSDSS